MPSNEQSEKQVYSDPITRKPIIYDDKVPPLLRGEIDITPMKQRYADILDRMNPVDRAQRGRLGWNLWVKANYKRWLKRLDEGDHIFIRPKYDTDDGFDALKVDFRQNQKVSDTNRYEIAQSDFCGFVFPSKTFFRNAVFTNDVVFNDAFFSGSGLFENTHFDRKAKFNGVIFGTTANFLDTVFHGVVTFKGANFCDLAIFDGSQFNGTHAWFDVEKFNGDTSFKSATFEAIAVFANTSFSQKAEFTDSNFANAATFKQVIFSGTTLFTNATFKEKASYENVTFSAHSDFSKVSFSKKAIYEEVNFEGRTSFAEVKFLGSVSFKLTKFDEYLSFYKAAFFANYRFEGLDFKRSFSCAQAVFLGNVSWYDCIFARSSNWEECQFLGSTSFENSSYKGNANFDHTTFGIDKQSKRHINYENWSQDLQRRYDAAKNVDATSENIPNFKGVTFKVAPNLGYTQIADPIAPVTVNIWQQVGQFFGVAVHSTEDPDASSKLRVLGELAARGHHQLAERRFFRTELLCRRGHETKGWREVAMINAFELFSGCGLQFWRPIEWLVRLMVLCACCYMVALLPVHASLVSGQWVVLGCFAGLSVWRPKQMLPASIGFFLLFYTLQGDAAFADILARTWGELFMYTGLNSLPVIGLSSDGYSVLSQHLFGEAHAVPVWVRFLAFVQNFISAIFLFFALLAVRNYFKLG